MCENLSMDLFADEFSFDFDIDNLDPSQKRAIEDDDDETDKENVPKKLAKSPAKTAESFTNSLAPLTVRNSENVSQSIHSQIRQLFVKNAEFLNLTPRLNEVNSLKFPETVFSRQNSDNDCFFGLPMIVKDLIQKFKSVTDLYDWQIECLTCDAIRNHKNLIYTSPTSGGKTLVAEILTFREILCQKKNVIFIMPYVAIVQEKVQDMSMFAYNLGFYLEEYAGNTGELPPRQRRTRNTVYFATIEKGDSLINSLIEYRRLSEIGLVIVDELHMLGDRSRGIVLESLLTKLMYVNDNIQIVGMSATIGNVSDISKFLKAEVYENQKRPVKLLEFIKVGADIFSVDRREDKLFLPIKASFKSATSVKSSNETESLLELILPKLPEMSHLIFCPTKQACENLTALLVNFAPRTLLEHKKDEKLMILNELSYESNVSENFRKFLSFGIVYHHAGLTSEERKIIEDGYRDGIVSVICCTSTLAAGVNLPAKRVIIRKPYVGRSFISVSQYKQMIGRAGRAGYNDFGESIMIVEPKEMTQVKQLLLDPVNSIYSYLGTDNYLTTFTTDCIYSGMAMNRKSLKSVLNHSLLAVQQEHLKVNIKNLIDDTISTLIKVNMISCTILDKECLDQSLLIVEIDTKSQCIHEKVFDDSTILSLTKFGEACCKASFDHILGRYAIEDIRTAKTKLVLLDDLHPLYFLVPHNCVTAAEPILQSNTYLTVLYETLINLNEFERAVCNALGITFSVIYKIPTTNLHVKNKKIFERIVRLYLALIINKYIRGLEIKDISSKYLLDTGFLQTLIKSTIAYAFQMTKFCESVEAFWPLLSLFRTLYEKLRYETDGEISKLLLLPNVKKVRAQMLFNAGFKTLGLIASSEPSLIVSKVKHVTFKLAEQLIASANLLLMEKLDDIQERAENEIKLNLQKRIYEFYTAPISKFWSHSVNPHVDNRLTKLEGTTDNSIISINSF